MLGRYRLVEKIGEGGMAEVFRAVVAGPRGFQREVVIKRILPSLDADPKFVKMLGDEARLCALLRHPGIVQVHELDEADGVHFLVMELVDGWDVRSILHKTRALQRPFPTDLACYVASELAGALAYAHGLVGAGAKPLGIVH